MRRRRIRRKRKRLQFANHCLVVVLLEVELLEEEGLFPPLLPS